VGYAAVARRGNFDPRTARFDVVIIDEASQKRRDGAGGSVPGKTVLVVGDHEQVSLRRSGRIGVIQNLIFQYLRGIPNSDLYDGQISIYDLARQSFGGTTAWSNISGAFRRSSNSAT